MHSGMTEWIIRLTLMSLVFIILLVALEFGLSKFAPHPRTFYEQNEYIGWKGIPGKEKRYADGRIASYLIRRAILNGGEVVSHMQNKHCEPFSLKKSNLNTFVHSNNLLLL